MDEDADSFEAQLIIKDDKHEWQIRSITG